MKRFIKWLVGIVILILALALIVAPYFVGGSVKSQIEQTVKAFNKQADNKTLKVADYQRGWWQSEVTLKATTSGAMPTKQQSHLVVHHGPIAFGSNELLPHSLYFGFASITGHLNIKSHQNDSIKGSIKGLDQPIQLGALLSWGGRFHLYIKTPAYEHKARRLTTHIGAINVQMHMPLASLSAADEDDMAKRTKASVEIAKSYVDVDSDSISEGYPSRISANHISWKNSFSGQPRSDWNNVVHAQIPKLTVQLKQMATVKFNNIQFNGQSEAKSGKIKVKHRLKINEIASLGAKINPFQLKWSLKNLDEDAFNDISDLYKKNKQDSDSDQGTQRLQKIFALLIKGMRSSQAQLHIQGKAPLGWIKLKAQAKADTAAINQLDDISNINASDFKAHGKITIDKDYLDPSKPRHVITQLIFTGAEYAKERDWLTKQGDQFQAKFQMTDGQPQLNGKPLSDWFGNNEKQQQMSQKHQRRQAHKRHKHQVQQRHRPQMHHRSRPQVQQHRPQVQQHRPQVQQHRPQVQQHRPQVQQHRPQVQHRSRPQVQEHNTTQRAQP